MKTIQMGTQGCKTRNRPAAVLGGGGWGVGETPAPSASPANARVGFTLIELLVVISVIALLASFTIAVLHGVAVTKYRSVARAELKEIEAALEAYKAQIGTYPPCNAKGPLAYTVGTNSMYSQLYYELSGVTNLPAQSSYMTLDGAAKINDSAVNIAFGVDGFVNCSRGSGDDATPARNYLPGLKQNRIANITNNGVQVAILVTSVRGPDTGYMPLGGQDVNPVRYVFPGVNNPQSYDLWVELRISGKTNLICNWSSSTIINSGIP